MLPTLSALQMLTLAGYIDFREEQEIQPRVRINVPRESLYEYDFTPEQEQMLNNLMRDYTGIFTNLVYLRHMTNGVNEAEHNILVSLAQRGIITYIPSLHANPRLSSKNAKQKSTSPRPFTTLDVSVISNA